MLSVMRAVAEQRRPKRLRRTSPDLQTPLAYPEQGRDSAGHPDRCGDSEMHEAFGVAPEDRPNQRGYPCPQHAVVDAIHRVGDVVQPIRQAQRQHPSADTTMIMALPPTPDQRLNADRMQYRDQVDHP